MFSQDELDDTAQVWNTHNIRPSKNPNVPSGNPNVMHALPELYRTTDYLAPVAHDSLQFCKDQCLFRSNIPCDPDVYELCNIVMSESHLGHPRDAYEAINLYTHLRNAVKGSLESGQ